MPSSELSCCWAKCPLSADSRESLLLGMPKICAEVVDPVANSLGLSRELYPKTATGQKYLTSQVFFMSISPTAFNRLKFITPQPVVALFNLLASILYPLTTGPINTNKLINL